MAGVTVFVDDAVLGRLPYICVKTGEPGEGLLTVHQPVGGGTRLGVFWLLLLAGPLGWVALLIIAVASQGNGDGETLTVQVPWTEHAQRVLDEAKRRRTVRWQACLVVAAAAIVTGWLTGYSALGGEMTTVLLFVAGLIGLTALGAGVAVQSASVDVRLDASRRWVTLGNVHPFFANAVEISRTGHSPAEP